MEEKNEAKENQEEVKEDEKNSEIETVIKLKKENDELKENFEKLQKDYSKDKKNYFDKVINNGTLTDNQPKFTSQDIQNMVNDISKGDLSNLEFWQTALKLSDAWKENYGKNLFNKSGKREDEIIANRVEETMRKMVQESNGNPDSFRILYNSWVEDSNPTAEKTLL